MTLVVTMVKPSGVWQSADYRLTDSRTGKVVTDSSIKQFTTRPYRKGGGCSVLAYTGLGRLPRDRKRRSIAEWLSAMLRGEQRPVYRSLEKIAELATSYIGDAYPHWFVAGGFLEGVPWLGNVTNMPPDSVYGQDDPHSEFQVQIRRFESGARGLAFAPHHGFITADDFRTLRKVNELETPPRDPEEFLDLLAAVTRRAHEAGNKIVSPSCSTVYLPPECDGARHKVHGDDPDLRGPEGLLFGLDFSETMDLMRARLQAMREDREIDEEEWDRRFEEAARRSATPESKEE